MRYTETKFNQHTLEFDSWQEYVDYAANTPSTLASGQRASRSQDSVHNRPERHHIVKVWAGYPSFEEAVDKSTNGWPEGAAELAKTFNDFHIPAQRTETEMAFTPVGPGTLAMGRYIQGHPEPFMVQRETDRMLDAPAGVGGVVHLGINISQNANVTATQRFQLGALILSLVDMLERNGKRVELTMITASEGSQDGHTRIMVKVKKADSSINMSILAACFANAGTQRRLNFSVRETLPAVSHKSMGIPNGGYAHSNGRWHPSGCTLVEGLESINNLNNKEETKAWLKRQLAPQGIAWDGE